MQKHLTNPNQPITISLCNQFNKIMNPTANNILVERIPDAKQTQSGIILKSSLEQDRATVLKTGPDITELNPNQTIILNWNQATHIEDELYIVPVTEVIAILE